MGETTGEEMKNLLIPFDVFERHKVIARFIKPGETILDVGGGVDALNLFIKNKVVVANLKSGDILVEGPKLPLKDNSFEVVTSIDVLEHIDQKNRQVFINELLRVSKKKVIFSTPYGSEGHTESEKKLLKLFEEKGRESFFLKEHVQKGLPQLKEIKDYLKDFRFQVFFAGDYRLNFFLTKLDLKSLKEPKSDKLFYWFKRSLNTVLNIFYFPFSVSGKEKKYTNRVYLLVKK